MKSDTRPQMGDYAEQLAQFLYPNNWENEVLNLRIAIAFLPQPPAGSTCVQCGCPREGHGEAFESTRCKVFVVDEPRAAVPAMASMGDELRASKPQLCGALSFDSRFWEIGDFAKDVENGAIKNEPMFFNSDLSFAWTAGGEITRSFISSLPEEWKAGPVVFDSRIHMLMPRWFPAIPGFHHDDVPRSPIPVGQHFATAGQPDYVTPRYRSEHIMGLVNASVAPTEFAVGECVMPAVDEGDIIYRKWHQEIERLILSRAMDRVSVNDRTLIQFDCNAFHQATRASASGWRWFGRISRNTERTQTVTNEIRRNAQVYLEFPMEGW